MKFQPKTEKQIAEEGLLPAGVYGFEVMEAKDAVSKSSNDMIVLKLRLFDKEGNSCGAVTDYLLETIAYKLRHAAVACGLQGSYEAGSLVSSEFIGKTGEVKIRITKDKNGQFSDQNTVADYVIKKEANGEPPADHPVNDPMPWDN